MYLLQILWYWVLSTDKKQEKVVEAGTHKGGANHRPSFVSRLKANTWDDTTTYKPMGTPSSSFEQNMKVNTTLKMASIQLTPTGPRE
jgi:hypothetical protein